jgi:pimeloyl-ACP methyl ester carboxylesterase
LIERCDHLHDPYVYRLNATTSQRRQAGGSVSERGAMSERPGKEPTPIALSVGGRRVAGLDWGGWGAPIVFLHANGFCAGMYEPIARRLAGEDYHPIGFDLRGHGLSDPPVAPDDFAFAALAGDVVGALAELGMTEVFMVGSSLGGGVAVWVNALAPGLVRHAVLAEAIAFDAPTLRAAANPLVEGARRRRINWPSREEMVTSYGSRPPLDALDPEALRAYIRYGTTDQPDGTVNLACLPETEAGFYERASSMDGGVGAGGVLGALAGRATIVCGARSDLGVNRFRHQAEAAGGEFVALEAGHLVLHEDTDRAVALLRERCEVGQPPAAERDPNRR